MTKRQKLAVFWGGMVLATIVFALAIWQGYIFFSEDLRTIKRKGTLIVVTDNSKWGCFTNEEGTYEGFNYEIITAFAKVQGLKIELTIENSTDLQIKKIKERKADILIQQIPITSYFGNKVAYTIPFFSTVLILVQLKTDSSYISEQHQLAKKTIYIPQNTAIKARIANLSDEIADSISVKEITNATTEELINHLEEKTITYTICNELQARMWKKKYDNIDFALPIGFQQDYAWVVNKNAGKLQQTLNAFLEEFIHTLEYRAIYQKYFN